MGGQTSFAQHLDHASRNLHFFLDTLNQDSHRMQVVLESTVVAVFGMRHRVTHVGNYWKFKRKTFHNLWIVSLRSSLGNQFDPQLVVILRFLSSSPTSGKAAAAKISAPPTFAQGLNCS